MNLRLAWATLSSMNREERFDLLRDEAKKHRDADREAAAVELLAVYLRERVGDAFAWFLYGEALHVVGRWREAKAAFRTALEHAPPERHTWMWGRLAVIYHEQNEHAKAEKYFARACRTDDREMLSWLWIYRGANFARWGNFVRAEKCHRRAARISENKDEAYLNLGLVLRAQRRYDEAAAALQQALRITPEYPEAQQALDSLAGVREAMKLAEEVE